MTNAPIDLAVFNELQEGMGSDFVGELVDTFRDEAPGMLVELRTALETHDVDQFRRAAHSIKSNADVFGARALAEMARHLELSGSAGDPEELRTRLGELDAAYTDVATTLKALVNG